MMKDPDIKIEKFKQESGKEYIHIEFSNSAWWLLFFLCICIAA